MMVYGCVIDKDHIETCFIDCVKSQTNFTAKELEIRLFSLGIERSVCYRAADRIIQSWKKNGEIFYDKANRCWRDIKYKDVICGK